MGGGSATGCADPSGAFPGQPTHRARGQAAAWARWPSDAAGGVCGLVRAGSASAVAPLPLCASPVQAGELKRRSRHTEYAVELATLRETGRRRAKVAQTWARDLKALLLELKAAVEQARAAGLGHRSAAARIAFVVRYQTVLAAGHAANPPPARRPRQRSRVKQTPAQNLLERLWLGQDQVLAFLDDLSIPFDNNQAERDLRMLKVQQKVSGSFRSAAGAAAFARLRGYLSTLGKQGVTLLAALEAL